MDDSEEVPETLTLTIEGYGYGGEGYAQVLPGRFISVPHACPGDRLRVRRGPLRRGRAWAEVLEVLERSPAHVDPACPFYEGCSGCALRHLSLEREARFKRESALEILERYGPPGAAEVDLGWIGGGGRLGHRARGRFSCEVRGGRVHLGLRSTRLAREVVDIRTCPAQASAFRRAICAIGARLDRDPGLAEAVESVEVRTTEAGASAARLDVGDPDALAALRALLEGVEGEVGGEVLVAGPDADPEEPRLRLGEGELVAPWSSWTHATPAIGRALVEAVAGWIEPGPHRRVLDLCCGVGTLTRRLAPLAEELVAVDEDYAACTALAASLERAGHGHVEVRPGRVGAILRKLRAEQRGPFDAAAINPMRRPLGEKGLCDLPALGVRQVAYLGPAAVSAARDAAVLHQAGYRLERASVVDLHPGTAQFMLALHLSLREEAA